MDYHLVIILSFWSIFLDLLLKIRHQFLFYRLDVLKNSLGAIQYPPRLEVLHIIRLVLALRSLETFFVYLILFGLFSVVSVQKSVRDKAEGIEVTDLYYGISWFATIISIVLLVIGLRNAELLLSEKGFYGMSFTLSLFAAIAVQKNTRDSKLLKD